MKREKLVHALQITNSHYTVISAFKLRPCRGFFSHHARANIISTLTEKSEKTYNTEANGEK